LLILILVVGAGIYVSRNASKLLTFYFDKLEQEMDRIVDPAVTVEQKAALKEELSEFRTHVSAGGKDPSEAKAIVLELNRSIRDERLSPEEVESLTARLREANDRMETAPAPQ